LGHFLVNSGVITEDEHKRAVERATTVGGKLGEALVALGVLSIQQLIDQLGRQARHKLVQALRWPQGAWRFDDSSEAVEGMQLRMIDVVIDGLRETAVEDLTKLQRLDGMSFELTERGKRLRHDLRKAFGERGMAILSAGAPMGEIEKAFGDRAQARLAVDAMLMCDAIVSKVVQVGLGAAEIPKHTLAGVSPAPPRTRTRERQHLDAADSGLYDVLFETEESSVDGAVPLDFEDEDSGIVPPHEIATASAQRDRLAAARKAVAAEHQRISGADLYAILLVDRDASADDVDAAFQVKIALLERNTQGLTDTSDRAKLSAIRTAYQNARTVLCDPRKRIAYDKELAGGELVQVPPAIDTELSFRHAEAHMAKEQWDQAVGLLRTVLTKSPGEADYHAALGWAVWNAGKQELAAADEARDHLNHALSINPDHAAAHDYKGRIDAALRVDEAAALFHLERALDLDPMRHQTLAAVEDLLLAKGDVRRFERVLKRTCFRLRGRGGTPEAGAYTRLATLYVEHLDDPASAQVAIANAKKLAPRDPDIAVLAERIERLTATREPIRAGWRDALGDPQAGAQLVRTTAEAGHADAAFLAASTMVALGTADDPMRAIYEAQRATSVVLPKVPLSRDHWSVLRHRDDTVELGALVELVAPAVQALAPMTLADAELDASQQVGDGELPVPFARLRNQLATVLGVPSAAVFARPELGGQVHVVACDPPVLVAGDEALTAPERPELAYKLARAMTFLWPGRAVGASRPGRVLRAVVLAIVRDAAGTELGIEDPLAARAQAAIASLTPQVMAQARAAALRLLSRQGGGLNLSAWAKSLSRTADRAALLLCGDIPAAFAGAREIGDLDKDLVEFAYSAAHVTLRRMLALTGS
ncbi:MAG: tetratricopeptide repeat protein, partial [Deltaproteobacteria bacterium]|nr:tetratricopeptide repeat protein [Deltaproteobacteria bacterium]